MIPRLAPLPNQVRLALRIESTGKGNLTPTRFADDLLRFPWHLDIAGLFPRH